MFVLEVLLYLVHVLVAFFLVLVVLLQQGKGADLSVFGGGSTQAAFGARGAATLLHKLTVGGFVIFTLTTLLIAVVQGNRGRSSVTRGMPAAEEEKAPAEAPPVQPPGQPPAQTPSGPPSPEAPAPEGSAPPADAAGTSGGGTTGGETSSGSGEPEPPAGSTLPDASPDG